tara:strand:+ start:183 stop:428 length:246 start_codon:yes stop_codon:yes gene_type:complete
MCIFNHTTQDYLFKLNTLAVNSPNGFANATKHKPKITYPAVSDVKLNTSNNTNSIKNTAKNIPAKALIPIKNDFIITPDLF